MVKRLREKWSTVRAQLRGGASSPKRVGQSVALGFFVGTLPFYGLQTLVSSALGWMLGLDVLVVALASNISLPPFIPVILYLDLTVGCWIVRGHGVAVGWSANLKELSELGFEFLIGSILVSAMFAGVGYGVGYLLGRRLSREKAPVAAPAALQA